MTRIKNKKRKKIYTERISVMIEKKIMRQIVKDKKECLMSTAEWVRTLLNLYYNSKIYDQALAGDYKKPQSQGK